MFICHLIVRNVAQSFAIMVVVLNAIHVNIAMVVIEMTSSSGDRKVESMTGYSANPDLLCVCGHGREDHREGRTRCSHCECHFYIAICVCEIPKIKKWGYHLMGGVNVPRLLPGTSFTCICGGCINKDIPIPDEVKAQVEHFWNHPENW